METLKLAFDTLRHLNPESMNVLASAAGPWLYVILFAIVFAETGLVAVPFLPGDSLLFTVGVVAASPGSPVSLPLTAVLLLVAAILGDAVNYAIGYWVGPRVFSREDSWLLNKKHLAEAQHFYDKYGGKTIIVARFMPVVRTFAPFVAGIGRMNYPKFLAYNVVGAFVWVVGVLLLGYKFASYDFVRKHFELVILAIVVISILPAFVEFARARLARRRLAAAAPSPAVVGGDDVTANTP